jgi:hypothetical protein
MSISWSLVVIVENLVWFESKLGMVRPMRWYGSSDTESAKLTSITIAPDL